MPRMAGITDKVVYNDDHGNAWAIRQPNWLAVLNGAVAATTEPNKPTGLKFRRRFLTDGTRERGLVVTDLTSPLWTDPIGTTETLYTGALGSPGEAFTTEGWVGEKLKAV